jgi:hypothetical protein
MAARFQDAMHFSQQFLRIADVFEDLLTIDNVEHPRIERYIHTVKRMELRVISLSRVDLRGLFNVKTNPLDRRI